MPSHALSHQDGNTALMFAIEMGHKNVAKKLCSTLEETLSGMAKLRARVFELERAAAEIISGASGDSGSEEEELPAC